MIYNYIDIIYMYHIIYIYIIENECTHSSSIFQSPIYNIYSVFSTKTLFSSLAFDERLQLSTLAASCLAHTLQTYTQIHSHLDNSTLFFFCFSVIILKYGHSIPGYSCFNDYSKAIQR